MLLSKDKKIFIYLFLLIFLGSINNKNFIDNRIFEIKNLKVHGLNQNEKIKLLIQLEQIKNQNIFFLPKKKIIEIFNSENLIESFLIESGNLARPIWHYPRLLVTRLADYFHCF